MAAATNTTAGQILMGGDFSTSSTGSAPELRATGVNSGSFTRQSLVIDAKGRILYMKTIPTSVILDAVPMLATNSVLGKVIVGENITNTAGTISMPLASTTVFGVAQPGTNMVIGGDGALRPIIPAATTTSNGYVMVGYGFNIDGGTLSHASWADATYWSKGFVRIDPSADSGLTASGGVVNGRVATDINAGQVIASSPDFYTASGSVHVNNAVNGYGIVYGVNTSTGLDISSGFLNFSHGAIPVASNITSGAVKIGSGLRMDSEFLSVDLPIATTSTVGAVKIGDGFTVSAGVISASLGTDIVKGRISYTTNFDNSSGSIQLKQASSTEFGVLRTVLDGDIYIPNHLPGSLTLASWPIPRKWSENTFSKTQTNALGVFSDPLPSTSFSLFSADRNQLKITVNQDTTITTTGGSIISGAVMTLVITAVANCNITFSTNFKLNQSSTIALTTGQTLSVTVITVSSPICITIVDGIF